MSAVAEGDVAAMGKCDMGHPYLRVRLRKPLAESVVPIRLSVSRSGSVLSDTVGILMSPRLVKLKDVDPNDTIGLGIHRNPLYADVFCHTHLLSLANGVQLLSHFVKSRCGSRNFPLAI
jgi:hypothetical protein